MHRRAALGRRPGGVDAASLPGGPAAAPGIGPGRGAPGGEGEVDVAWLYPRVPHHGIPCAAFAANPSECPVALGGALPESTGVESLFPEGHSQLSPF